MKIILFIITLFMLFEAKASHIVGGDIYYDYLGGNSYRFYITLYRDCFSTGAQYDNPLTLGVYIQNSGNPVQTISVPFPGSVTLPVIFNNPCGTAPTNICVEKAIYTTVLNLPPTPGGYTVTYQRCCRGPNVTNLNNPDDTGITLTTHVPGSETGATINSSPRYTNYPPLVLCNNDVLVFNHSATDPDGDQLVYSLVNPWAGASGFAPAPNPPPGPPYFPVNWAGGYNAVNPMGPGSSVTINSTTGILTVSPNMLGLFVVGVRVQEYRNGVLIGQTVRDFLFKVFNCNITMQALLPTQEQLPTFDSYCQGLTVPFVNNSWGGTSYSWDFGVPGITTDVSTVFAPTYTYPAPGIYTAMLVVNPGQNCTDTAYMTVNVNTEFNVSFTSDDSLCIVGNSFNFVGQSDGSPASTYVWDFGPNASVTTATTLNVNNVSYSVPGLIPVTLTGTQPYCTATFTDTITVFQEPIAIIDLPSGYECDGLTVSFGNSSAGIADYHWDFGVNGISSDTSNLTNPTFTFPAGGTYDVTLIGGSSIVCIDTTIETITVNPLLSISFTNNDSLCITNNSFNFDGQMTGPSFTDYFWNFGPNASPSTSTDLDVNGVVFSTFGSIPITLTASFDNCVETFSNNIFIYREPMIDFRAEPGPRCAPDMVQFTNLSVADSPIFYSWTFGDDGTSSEENPSHYYSNPGSYNVGLTIYTTEGCIDTLYLLQQDYITMHPYPVSQFNVDPIETDICHAQITFTDESQGASTIFYWFDDSTFFANQANVVYNYVTSGTHRPMQIATTEFGCKDTSFRELYIEPFVLYIPNTFTPDGDEFNNIFNAVYALEIFSWEMQIYNRWGELVFVTNDTEIGWDGTFNGKIIQDDTYAYIIKYESCEKPGIWQMITGHVNMLR